MDFDERLQELQRRIFADRSDAQSYQMFLNALHRAGKLATPEPDADHIVIAVQIQYERQGSVVGSHRRARMIEQQHGITAATELGVKTKPEVTCEICAIVRVPMDTRWHPLAKGKRECKARMKGVTYFTLNQASITFGRKQGEGFHWSEGGLQHALEGITCCMGVLETFDSDIWVHVLGPPGYEVPDNVSEGEEVYIGPGLHGISNIIADDAGETIPGGVIPTGALETNQPGESTNNQEPINDYGDVDDGIDWP